MTEAPTPTLKPINDFSINIENEGKNYEIIFSQKSNNLLIISKELNSFPSKRYEEEFSKNNLNEISKFFLLFNNISEILTELKIRIEKNNFEININENTFEILFKVEISNINEFNLILKRKEEDIKSIVETLCSIIKKQEEKINKLEEEKIETNIKIKKLQEEKNKSNNRINKLEEELNKSNNTIKKLEEESNKKIKQLENEINDIKNPLKIFKESKILKNKEEEIMISNWIKPNSKIKFTLLYQISRDGDNIITFYNKVKNKFPTLILIKSKSGFIFGGYTNNTWEETKIYKKDLSAFLFSLNKKKKYYIKNNHIQNGNYGDNFYFAFGSGHDICIFDKCTSNKNNYCNPRSYNTTEKYELNGGKQNFYVDELEVYNVEY